MGAAATGMGLSMPTQTTSDGHAVQSFASQQSMAPPQSSLLLQVLSASAVGASDPFSGMIKADAHRARMDAVKQAKLEKKKGRAAVLATYHILTKPLQPVC